MKLFSYKSDSGLRAGLLYETQLFDLRELSGGRLPSSLLQFIQTGEWSADIILNTISSKSRVKAELEDVQISAPIINPSKIIAVGLNYEDHAIEIGVNPPEKPIIFSKFTSSITGPYDEIYCPSSLTSKLDYEVELGVVIGTPGYRISEKTALNHVFGYMVLNDLSARDLQFSDHSGQWDLGKSLDGFCPCGPYIVTRDEVPDPQCLSIECRVNDKIVQSSNTSNMLFTVQKLISYVSQGISLFRGDIIATGTPAGVGFSQSPPLFLADDDECICKIDGLGTQRNKIRIN